MKDDPSSSQEDRDARQLHCIGFLAVDALHTPCVASTLIKSKISLVASSGCCTSPNNCSTTTLCSSVFCLFSICLYLFTCFHQWSVKDDSSSSQEDRDARQLHCIGFLAVDALHTPCVASTLIKSKISLVASSGCCRYPKHLHSLHRCLSGDFIVDIIIVVVSLLVVNTAILLFICSF